MEPDETQASMWYWHKSRGRWSIDFGWYGGEPGTPALRLDIMNLDDEGDYVTVFGVQSLKLCFTITLDLVDREPPADVERDWSHLDELGQRLAD